MREAARMPRTPTTDVASNMSRAPGPIAVALLLTGGALACLRLPVLPPAWVGLVVSVAIAALVCVPQCRQARFRFPARCASIALAGGLLAGIHAHFAIAHPMAFPGDGRIAGRIVELPVVEARRVRFLLRIDNEAGQPEALRGRLVRLAWYDDRNTAPGPRPEAGSRWQLDVRLRTPRGLRNPGTLDAERHAFAQRIAATGHVRNAANARMLSPPSGLHAWRARTSARIDAAITRPSDRFVRALALGDTRGLTEADWNTLRATGLTHLIAISGFHVGLVAGFFAMGASVLWRMLPSLALRLPRPPAMAVAALVGALLYTAAAGFALPTVRTSLMIAVVAGARFVRRPLSNFGALALAVTAMVLVDPLSLLGAGFWLSVCGVAWLVWCLPRGDTSLLRGFAAAQAVATIGLLPLTVALFGQASLAGPIANLVAIPWWSLVVVPLSLLGTGLDTLRDGAGDRLWQAAAFAFDWPWPWFEGLGASRLALWWLPESRWFALPMALAAAFWLLLPRGVPGKAFASLAWLPLLYPSRGLPPQGGVRLDVLDVGQGLSVLVRTQSHAILFDMGPAQHDGYDAGERAVVPALRALGVRKLDVAIISHADSDHAGGWPSVRRAFPVAHTHAPDGSPTAADTPCIAGGTWQHDGVVFRFLHPTQHFPYLGNEAGCVLRIETRHGAALLTGDIGEVVERTLLHRDRTSVRAEVVLVPHHGSDGSSDPAFIRATGARHALVASGAGNRFGHPRPAVVARWCEGGAQVSDTGAAGALRVDIGPAGTTVSARRATHPRLWDATPRSARSAGLCYRPHQGEGPATPRPAEE
jgi:competence protein ComEC